MLVKSRGSVWAILLACTLAIVTGVAMSHTLSMSSRLDLMSHDSVVRWGLLLAVGLWLTPILSDVIRHRGIDWSSPRVFFGLVYLISSFGRLILRYVTHRYAEGLRLYEAAIPEYVFLVILGFVGFLFGTSFARRGSLARHKWTEGDGSSNLTFDQLQRLERLAIMAMAVSVVILAGFSVSRFHAAVFLGARYGESQMSSGVDYYTLLLPALLFGPASILACYSSARSRGRLSFTVKLLVALYVFFHGLTGDRGSALTGLLGFGLAWHYFFRRLRFVHLLAASLLVLGYSLLVVYWRTSWSFDETRAMISGGSFVQDGLAVILRDFGAPAFTTTHIMSWFPGNQGYYWGLTYVHAVFSLVPGFFFGGRLARPFISPSFIFKSLIEQGGFNPNQGYGFSLLAEAYMNFGWLGPCLVMFLIGWLLQLLYERAQRSGKWWVLPFFVIVYSGLPFALRSDAVGAMKHLVYGALFLFVSVRLIEARNPDNSQASRIVFG